MNQQQILVILVVDNPCTKLGNGDITNKFAEYFHSQVVGLKECIVVKVS